MVFLPSLMNGFTVDDFSQFVDNPSIRSLSNIGGFFLGGSFINGGSPEGVYYKPLMQVYFALVYSVFGANPIAYHMFQLLLHIANAIAVYFLFKNFFKPIYSFVASLIFLVHPINSEAVYSISAVQEPLFFLFGMLGFLLIIKDKKRWHLLPVLGFFILSIFSKETGFLFLIAAVAYLFLYDYKRIKAFVMGLWLPVLVYFILRILSVGLVNNPLNAPITGLGFWERMMSVPEILFYYASSFIAPINLGHSNRWIVSSATFWEFYFPMLAVLFIVILFAVILVIIKRAQVAAVKGYLFFAIWMAAGLTLHLQFYPLDMTVSERWFYFPMTGVLALVIYSVQVLGLYKKFRYIWIVFVAVIILFSARTFVRGFDWHDDLKLSKSELSAVRDDFSKYFILADISMKEGRYDDAVFFIKKSTDAYPYFINYQILGDAYFLKADYIRAKMAYEEGVNHGAHYPSVEMVAIISLLDDDPSSGIHFIEKYLDRFPKAGRLWAILAALQYKDQNEGGFALSLDKALSVGVENNFLDSCIEVANGNKAALSKLVNLPR
jgi:tetratricopeptide (TPR) repeat protein